MKKLAQDESIKKKREEFYTARTNILDTLERIDREIQEYLPCTTKALKDQENLLYVNNCRFFFFCFFNIIFLLIKIILI